MTLRRWGELPEDRLVTSPAALCTGCDGKRFYSLELAELGSLSPPHSFSPAS